MKAHVRLNIKDIRRARRIELAKDVLFIAVLVAMASVTIYVIG